MIVKGLIKTIDFSANTCTVRLPIFETAASKGEVILDAVMMSQPGLYNGYTEGDIVFVDFENDKLSQPIVIGKLYLGADREASATPQGSLAVSNLTVTKKATLPIDTQLVLEDTSSAVPVENGITSYKSITDIIKALYKTEATVEQTIEDQSEVIATIKIEYLSQPTSASAPEAVDPNWQTASPEYADEYSIWQKTTCYNHRGQILSVEILCLTDLNASAMYRLRCSTKVHAGPNQTEAVTVLAMVKLGSGLEIQDNAAVLRYRWGEYGNPVEILGSKLYLSPSELQEKNLIVELLHRDTGSPDSTIYHTYDTETLMYAPLNTPIIRLSKDTDVILYTADGTKKLGDNVQSTAELYVNGDVLDATYSWSWDPSRCTCSYPVDENDQPVTNSIVVSAVNSDTRTGTITCAATVTKEGPFFGKTYTKDFTVTQTRVGENATSYWLTSSCTVHTGKKHHEALTVTAMKQFGVSLEEIDTTAKLWWKYKSEANTQWRVPEEDAYRLILAYNNISDDDILVLATHNLSFDPRTEGVDLLTDSNIYEREEITFSPLNTPIISLTNDSGAILYGSNGQKMNIADTVTTTAELYLNGTKLPDADISYQWEVTDCITDTGATEGIVATTPTIIIKDLSENTAYATCTATYKTEPYTKTFTIVKQVQGISIVSQTVYYALLKNGFEADSIAPPYFDVDSGALCLDVYTKEGEELSNTETLGSWSTTPPEHTVDTNGWKYWTTVETVYSTGAISFSNPIINEDLSGVYSLAQGKSTNYYGAVDPAGTETDKIQGSYGTAHSSQKKAIKDNDCWFCTKEVATYTAYKTFGNLPEYIGYFVKDGDNYYEVTADNLSEFDPQEGGGEGLMSIVVGTTMAYKKTSDSPTLYQWNNGKWEDVGNELIANKVTANYINALDITAQKVKVLDANAATLFEANGLHRNSSDRLDPYVTIGGFTVHENTLTTGEPEAGNLINISSDNTNIFSVTEGLSDLTAGRTTTWASGVAKVAGAFKRNSQLVAVAGSGSSTPNFYKYQALNDFNAAAYYSVAKITFKQEAPSFTLYLNCNSSNRTADYVMASEKFEKNYTGEIPGAYNNPSTILKASTYGLNTTAHPAVTYENIKKDQVIYIVYRHGSSVHTSTIGANVFLPVNIRLSIGENFQVLADGTVFAKNLYLGVEPSTFGSNEEYGDDAAGQLASVNADLQTAKGELSAAIADVEQLVADEVTARTAAIEELEADIIAAKKIEVYDNASPKNLIFKADGAATTVTERVQVGGFKVGNKKLYAGSTSSGTYVELGTEAIMLGGNSTETAPFYVNKEGDLKAESGMIGGFILAEDGITSTNQNLQLNKDGSFIAKSGDIGGFKINPNGLTGLYSDYLQFDATQVYFPKQAYFNLNNRVKIYAGTPTTTSTALGDVKNELTSYITTDTSDASFIIRNKAGAGLKFSKDESTTSMDVTVTINGPTIGGDGGGVAYRNEHVVDGGYWGGSSYYYEAWWDYTCTVSSLQPEPITVEWDVQVFDIMYQENKKISGKCTIPAYTQSASGSLLIDVDATYTPGMTQYGYDPSNTNNSSAVMGMAKKGESISRVNKLTVSIGSFSTKNRSIYSLGHFMPYTTDCTLGSDSKVWASLHIKSAEQYSSDRNLKNSIEPVASELDVMYDAIKPVSYKFNDGTSDRRHFGFIAQDLQQSLKDLNIDTKEFAPLCIPKNNEDYMSVRYTEFIPLNTDQIQKLKKRVAQQEARIDELERIIKELKK